MTVFSKWLLIPVIIMMGVLNQCTPAAIMNPCIWQGELLPGGPVSESVMSDCVDYVTAVCMPEVDFSAPEFDMDQFFEWLNSTPCFANAANDFYYDFTHPTPTPVVEAPHFQCPTLHLTSPLDGLPDGVAAFYWDGLSVPNVQYTITVMEQDYSVLATFPAGTAWNVSGDVSRGAIGGGYQLWVRVTATTPNGTCLDEHLLWRETPYGVQPPPSPTPRIPIIRP